MFRIFFFLLSESESVYRKQSLPKQKKDHLNYKALLHQRLKTWLLTCSLNILDVPGGTKELACQCRWQEMWLQSLGRYDSLEKGMATHSRILAWRIPSIEESGWLWPIASQRVEHNGRKEARAHTRTPTQWTWVWASPGSWWWTGKPGVLQSMGPQSRTWLSNWTEPNWTHTHTGHFNISPKTLFLNVDFIPRFVTSCLVYGSPFLAIVHWTI